MITVGLLPYKSGYRQWGGLGAVPPPEPFQGGTVPPEFCPQPEQFTAQYYKKKSRTTEYLSLPSKGEGGSGRFAPGFVPPMSKILYPPLLPYVITYITQYVECM